MDESFATRLRQLRTDQGLSQRELARKAYCSQGMVSRLESGESCSLEMARALDLALGAEGALLEVAPGMAQAAPSAYPDPVVMVRITLPDGTTMDVPLDRRTLLGLTGAATLAASVPTAGLPGPEVAASAYRTELTRYRQLGETQSPDDVSALMVPTVAAIDALSRSAPSKVRRELLILGARYCDQLAWLRQEAGDIHGAWTWSDRAVEWATIADWSDLPPYILARKAAFAGYLGDWPRSVELAATAARTARTPGIRARALSQQARGYAFLGRRDDCQRTLDRARHWTDRSAKRPHAEPPLPLGARRGFASQHVAHVEASCLLNVGRPDDAIDSYERRLARRPADSSRGLANVQSWLAVSYARAGAPERAAEIADQALSRVERIPSASVTSTLRLTAAALGPWRDRDDVRDITHRVRQLTGK